MYTIRICIQICPIDESQDHFTDVSLAIYNLKLVDVEAINVKEISLVSIKAPEALSNSSIEHSQNELGETERKHRSSLAPLSALRFIRNKIHSYVVPQSSVTVSIEIMLKEERAC